MQILLLIIGAVLGESVYDAAKIARDLVHGVGVVGELATIMQSNSHGVAGVPYTSLQMVWDCDNEPGYPMVGLVSWGTHAKNVQTNANASIQIRHPSLYPTVDNPANRPGFLNNPRFTIFGKFNPSKAIRTTSEARKDIRSYGMPTI
ncbi:hypothetical protein HDV02_000883 [Globomyces sp. JEL0801]|nr:hypothetical protein HDV02_000883 [Globomyces sp. JEL0801]